MITSASWAQSPFANPINKEKVRVFNMTYRAVENFSCGLSAPITILPHQNADIMVTFWGFTKSKQFTKTGVHITCLGRLRSDKETKVRASPYLRILNSNSSKIFNIRECNGKFKVVNGGKPC